MFGEEQRDPPCAAAKNPRGWRSVYTWDQQEIEALRDCSTLSVSAALFGKACVGISRFVVWRQRRATIALSCLGLHMGNGRVKLWDTTGRLSVRKERDITTPIASSVCPRAQDQYSDRSAPVRAGGSLLANRIGW